MRHHSPSRSLTRWYWKQKGVCPASGTFFSPDPKCNERPWLYMSSWQKYNCATSHYQGWLIEVPIDLLMVSVSLWWSWCRSPQSPLPLPRRPLPSWSMVQRTPTWLPLFSFTPTALNSKRPLTLIHCTSQNAYTKWSISHINLKTDLSWEDLLKL